MRPLTDGEYKRMQQHAESRFAGLSEVAFEITAKLSGDTSARIWYETGYFGDFVFGGFNSRYSNSGDPRVMVATQTTYVDKVPATLALPIRYMRSNAFTVKSKEPKAEPFLGVPFDVQQLEELGTYTQASGWPPVVSGLRVLVHNNEKPPVDYHFEIVSNPYVGADSIQLDLRGEKAADAISIWDEMDGAGIRTYARLMRSGGILYLDWNASPFSSLSQAKAYANSVKGTIWVRGRARSIR